MASKRDSGSMIYEHYCKWMNELGIAPAPREEYERVNRTVASIPSFMPTQRGHYSGSGD